MRGLRFSLLVSALLGGSVGAVDLNVDVRGLRVATGLVKISVVDTSAAWDGAAKPIAAIARKAEGAEMRFVFPGLVAGRYAVQVMHDENNNGKLDTNIVGMPMEGYGFSRNPRVMRKPTFEEALFELSAEVPSIRIDLR